MNNLRTAEERNTFESWVSIGATIESKVNNSQVDVRGYFVDADGFVDRIRPVPCTIEDVSALLELVNNSPLISEQELTNIMGLIPSTKEIQANQILFYIHSLHLTVANANEALTRYNDEYYDHDFVESFRDQALSQATDEI
jgi:hypothetical protein